MLGGSITRNCVLALGPRRRLLVHKARTSSFALLSVGGILCCYCPSFISAFLVTAPQPRQRYHPLIGTTGRPLISYPPNDMRARLLSRAAEGGRAARGRGGEGGSGDTAGQGASSSDLLRISDDFDAFDVEDMGVDELRMKLKERSLSVDGDVEVLRERLLQHLLQKLEGEEAELESPTLPL
uniref:SAP domain-containing protein n=1 Tax=Guillardia theta TaxID=55529 RepID=A0A7S4UPI6_GUITH|mmetsp:Transcript_50375/g.157331  ORF Transcript_50375/g.157331 Transcript_50375/m.157331 type:complete len:182 (+) Transcript_50375:313-858(+)